MAAHLDPDLFRQVLGQYPTGVVVVTAVNAGGEPVGMTVGSFTSVSLDPPLVAFLPDKGSSFWRALRESGSAFCINVLGAEQEGVCRQFAARGSDKFAGVKWERTSSGNPVIEGSVAYIDCSVEDVYDAGDHDIVLGRVLDLEVKNSSYPLLFFRGGYGSFTPLSLASGDTDLLDQLGLIDLARPQMEAVAADLSTEVTATVLVRDELVLAAAAGRTRLTVAPTRVGQRMPFMPPMGSVFAAWGGDHVRDRWLEKLDPSAADGYLEEYRSAPERIRRRGYAVGIGHQRRAELEDLAARLAAADPEVSATPLREAIATVASGYNPEFFGEADTCELASLAAPVFRPNGDIAFALTLWGPPGEISRRKIDDYAAALVGAADRVSAAIATT